MSKRIKIYVELNLDPVPGWGNKPEDFVVHTQRLLDNSIPHYNPTVFLVDKKSEEHKMTPPDFSSESDNRSFPSRGVEG